MNIVEVVPLSRANQADTLTYFTGREIGPGALVAVPLRQKLVPALVLESTSAAAAKTSLRRASHSLKKVSRVLATNFLSPAFIAAARGAAEQAAAPLGATLYTLLPQTILTAAERLPAGPPPAPLANSDSPFKPEVEVLQDTDEERLGFYKALIREHFARGASVWLVLPTASEVRRTVEALGRGIAEYLFAFHSQLSKKDLLETWQKAVEAPHPILLVGTPNYLALPRSDVKIYIVDRENTSSYKSLFRPFSDYRLFARLLAAQSGARLLYGDLYPRTETLREVELKNWSATHGLKQRLLSSADNQLIPAASGELFMPPLADLLADSASRSERTLILANRRGLAPLVVCDDCGQAINCPRCETPLVLHSAKNLEEREGVILLCHHCNHRAEAPEACAHCQSWRLRALGTGTERVVAAIKERWPERSVLRLDSDSAGTPKQAEAIIGRFLAAPGGVLVATELVAHHLHEAIENVLIVAADAAFSLPDFRLHERLFTLLARLRSLASKHFYIQTRYAEEALFSQLIKGNLLEFYRAEAAEREEFGYPPFKRLIKVTLEAPRELARREMAKLARLLEPYQPTVYPSFQAIRKGRYRLNLLLKLPLEPWPLPELVATLRALPPSFIVNVDPDDIL